MSKALVKTGRKKLKIPKPIQGFMQVISDTPIDPNDPESITYAERLAQHAWEQALSEGKDSIKWAALLLERTEGKVPNEHRLEDAHKLVDQITAKLMQSGLDLAEVQKMLEAMGVDRKYLPTVDYVEGELVQ